MVCDQMNTELRQLGLCDKSGRPVAAEDLVEIIDGYTDLPQKDIGRYNKTCNVLVIFSSSLLDMIHTIASSTGIIFDSAFTMKVFRGMTCEMEKNPDRFKGRRVLFVHTGTPCLFYFNYRYFVTSQVGYMAS